VGEDVLVDALAGHGEVLQDLAAVVDDQRDRARGDAGLAGGGEEGVAGLDLELGSGRRGGAVVGEAWSPPPPPLVHALAARLSSVASASSRAEVLAAAQRLGLH
jgi:hypothetical protein